MRVAAVTPGSWMQTVASVNVAVEYTSNATGGLPSVKLGGSHGAVPVEYAPVVPPCVTSSNAMVIGAAPVDGSAGRTTTLSPGGVSGAVAAVMMRAYWKGPGKSVSPNWLFAIIRAKPQNPTASPGCSAKSRPASPLSSGCDISYTTSQPS